MKRILLPLLLLGCLLAACSDNDSFSADRGNRLTFSADTVAMDTVFSTVGSSTYTFWVFNNSGDGIRLTSVRLKNGNQTGFRANVDGSYLDNTMVYMEFRLNTEYSMSISHLKPESWLLFRRNINAVSLFCS